MERYEPAAVERAMKVQEVILKAMAGQMTGCRRPRSTPLAPNRASG